jgi:hypothetical protein
LDSVSLADLSELEIDLALEDGLWFGSLVVIEALFGLGSVFCRLLNDLLSDLELGDVAALSCKLVAVAVSLGLFTVVVALEHLIAQLNASPLKQFYFAC